MYYPLNKLLVLSLCQMFYQKVVLQVLSSARDISTTKQWADIHSGTNLLRLSQEQYFEAISNHLPQA